MAQKFILWYPNTHSQLLIIIIVKHDLTVCMCLCAGLITVENIKSIIRESILMKDFDHPNVLNVLGVGFNTDNGLPFVVLPFMENGDLKTYLKKRRQKDAAVDQLLEVALWL